MGPKKLLSSFFTQKCSTIFLPVFVGMAVLIKGASFVGSTDSEVTWWNINRNLTQFVNNRLMAEELQEILNNDFIWHHEKVDGKQRLNKIVQRVSEIFNNNIKVVKELKKVIENEYPTWPAISRDQANSSIFCCEMDKSNLAPDGCSLLVTPEPTSPVPTKATYAPPSVIRAFKNSEKKYNEIIAQYYAFDDGSLYMYPASSREQLHTCNSYDARLRYFFTQSQSPEPREAVLVVDTLHETNDELLLKLVDRILKSLSPVDRMALCLPDNDKCRIRQLGTPIYSRNWTSGDFPLTSRPLLGVTLDSSHKNKKAVTGQLQKWLKTRLHSREFGTSDNFSSPAVALLAGNSTFQRETSFGSSDEYHRILWYITDREGFFELMDQAMFKQKIFNDFLNVHLIMHPIIEEKLTTKNKDLIDEYDAQRVKISPLEHDFESLSSPIKIPSFGLNDPNRAVIPVPYWDAFGRGYIMSICLPLTENTKFVGAVCTDISIVNLLETETDVEDIENAYVFIVNSLGNTLMHPLLPSPYSIKQDPTYVPINRLEQASKVQPLLPSIIRQIEGSKDIRGEIIQPIGRPSGTSTPSPVRRLPSDLRYQWIPIDKTDLTIALVLPLKDGKAFSRQYRCSSNTSCETPNFHYHKSNPSNNITRETCNFFGTEVTDNVGLIKFAPNCFIDVLSYMSSETDAQISDLYKIFQGEIPHDEVLRRDLHASVKLLEKAEELWKRQSNENRYPNLTRFMGTADGAFINFPGTALRQAYDHRKRPWYLRAVSNSKKDSIVLTSPYWDELGAGMVYTITKTLYDSFGNPMAVISGDTTFSYLMEDFKKQVPLCKKNTCLLIDRMGYVVLKSDWSTPFNDRNDDIQSAHLNRLAPDIAGDMIANYNLRRQACHDYEQDLTFYYWSFSLLAHSTLLIRPSYRVHKISLTSLYLIVRTDRLTESNCNCDPFQKGENATCTDTCAFECECPCVAGPQTIPCHDPDFDIHRFAAPACKPRGLILVKADNSTINDLTSCK